jgi:2-dehydropantoate 2-reductase
MRILVLGAGAVGGYFGGRLLAAGRDVTFLVREERARRMQRDGLSISSDAGSVHLSSPPTLQADQIREPFDLVLLSCKAYDLDSAINSVSPAVGSKTLILPLLNGMRHLDSLDERFGRDAVLGGTCFISTRLEDGGVIAHLSDVHKLAFGARDPSQSERVGQVTSALDHAGFELVVSDVILLQMWEKWIFVAAMAALTCLFRGTIGDVSSSGGRDIAKRLLDECTEVARGAGYPPRPEAYQFALERLTNPESLISASMLTDLENQRITEADHILGDLLARRTSDAAIDLSLLRTAVIHMQVAQRRLTRNTAG